MNVEKLSVYQEIRNFLLTIFGGIAFAALLIWGMINYYEPSRSYTVDTVLLAPSTMLQLGIKEISYLYFDEEKSGWETLEVPFKNYESFYSSIAGLKSLKKVEEKEINQFNQGTHSTVLLIPSSKTQGNIFQELQIAKDGSLFRVELRDYNAMDRWVYFRAKNSGQKGLKEILMGKK